MMCAHGVWSRWAGHGRLHPAAWLVIVSVVILALLAGTGTVRAWDSTWPPGSPTNRITALAIAPSDGRVVYASTIAGLYRSGDAGVTWTQTSGQTDITQLAVDPASSDVVYAYVWSEVSDGPRGFRKSVDGGKTWTDPTGGAAAGIAGQATALLVDPTNGKNLLLGGANPAGNGRILRSTDGGASWQVTYDVASLEAAGRITALAITPAAPNVVYAAHMVYHGGPVVRSDDGGLTWRILTSPPLPLSFAAALAVAPNNPNVVTVAVQIPMGGGVRLFRSIDGGASWQGADGDLPHGPDSSPILVAHRSDPQVLFLAMQQDRATLYQTWDGGQIWTNLLASASPNFKTVTALRVSPDGQMLYVGTDNGVWRNPIRPAIAAPFVDFYHGHDGWRILGSPLSRPLVLSGRLVQYFEKGRLEDHSQEESDPNWKLMYGLLADELQQARANVPVGSYTSSMTYLQINELARPDRRVPPPPGFGSGVVRLSNGSVFVPYDAHLRRAAGHTVPPIFWSYINRTDLFPGGWLHDIGLPMMEPATAIVDKGEARGRQIMVQAFQRTVLTYDPLNPADWQVERDNVGADYLLAFPDRVGP